MQACMTDMSIAAMSGIAFMLFDISSIIIESIAHRFPRGFRLMIAGRTTRLSPG